MDLHASVQLPGDPGCAQRLREVQGRRTRRQSADLLCDGVELLTQDRKLAPGFLRCLLLLGSRDRVESREGLPEAAAYPSPLLLELSRNAIGDSQVAGCEQAEEALCAGGFLNVEGLFVAAQLQLDGGGGEVDPAPESAEIRLHVLRAAEPPDLRIEGPDRLAQADGGLLKVARAPGKATQTGQGAGFSVGSGAHAAVDREGFLMVGERTLPVPPPGFHVGQPVPAPGCPRPLRGDVGEQAERAPVGDLGAVELARGQGRVSQLVERRGDHGLAGKDPLENGERPFEKVLPFLPPPLVEHQAAETDERRRHGFALRHQPLPDLQGPFEMVCRHFQVAAQRVDIAKADQLEGHPEAVGIEPLLNRHRALEKMLRSSRDPSARARCRP